MKKLIFILVVLGLSSCNSEQANDCFKTTGDITSETFAVSEFDKILVGQDIQLTIQQDEELTVSVEAGENSIGDIQVEVVNGELQLTNENTCNLFRNYTPVKVLVKTPDVSVIRNASQFEVKSKGVLELENLSLYSEDYNSPDSFNVGDFNLDLNVNQLQVVSNNISMFYISGKVQSLSVGFYAGAGRFEGGNLIAQDVKLVHKGTNDIIVNPQNSISGEISGTGNVSARNKPEFISVTEKYKGRLLFID